MAFFSRFLGKAIDFNLKLFGEIFGTKMGLLTLNTLEMILKNKNLKQKYDMPKTANVIFRNNSNIGFVHIFHRHREVKIIF